MEADIILIFTTLLIVGGDDASDAHGFCRKTEESVICDNPENLRLKRLSGEKVGEYREIFINGGRGIQMKTSCLKPLVFEIEDFLTNEECDHFISVAKQIGMQPSITEKMSSKKGIGLMDINSDQHLSIDEMKLTIENEFDIYLEDQDVLDMYQELRLDTNNDMILSREEIYAAKPATLGLYLQSYISKHPEKNSRYSKQAWPYLDKTTDKVFLHVQERVSKVIELPLSLIHLSDFQVVNYGVDGHYNAHLDSSQIQKQVPCCDKGKEIAKHCRICRFMTILFYLNDVEAGGETAFPIANNETFNENKAHSNRVYHLYRNCEEANLRIFAQKRKAVIWYNHFVDDASGWMGEIDEFTLHGGCPVQKGEKWIANFWIKTTDDKLQDIERMRTVMMK